MEKIPAGLLEQAMDYPRYRQLIDELWALGKTTGDNHSEAMLHYTQLNITRMKRLDKTARLSEETLSVLHRLDRPLIWLTLTEAWCGDAAQSIPVLAKMAEQSEHISLKLLLRDEQPELMDAFLTNGGRSIPKAIIVDAETREVLGSWGPRPAALQLIVDAARKELASITDEAEKKAQYQLLTTVAQKWYAKDKTKSVQEEFLALHEVALAAAKLT